MGYKLSTRRGTVLDSEVLNNTAPGQTFAVVGPASMEVRNSSQLMVDQIVEASSGTTETLDMKLQQSADVDDADAWHDVPSGAFTETTGTGHKRVVLASTVVFGPFVRIVAEVGGADHSFTVTVYVNGKA